MRYLVQGQDYLFNLAGQTSHLDSMQDPYTDLEINCRAQLSILEACRKHNPGIKIVFASTRQIYGKPDYLPVDEKHLLRPVDVNGINKMAGEWYHILYNNVYGIRACALRLTNTYGPRMRVKDARQTFLGHLDPAACWRASRSRSGAASSCATSTTWTTPWRRLLLAAAAEEANGQVFNLGGERGDQPGGRWPRCWSRSTAAASIAGPRLPGRPQADRHRRLLRRRPADPRSAGLAAARAACARGWRARWPSTANICRHYL